MPLKKGQTNNPNGRPKGSKNERTKEWEALADSIITKHAKRFDEVLESMSDEDFAKNYLQSLVYFKPKKAAATIEAKLIDNREDIEGIFPKEEDYKNLDE